MLNDMKVATKLTLGFGVLIIMLALVSFIGISRMAQIDASLDQVMEERWPRAQMAGSIIERANTIAIAMRNMMLTNNPQDRAQQKQLIMETRTSLGATLDKLQAQVTSAKGIELLQARAQNWQPGDPLNPATPMGAIVEQRQTERILSYIEKGKASARLVAGGEQKTIGRRTLSRPPFLTACRMT